MPLPSGTIARGCGKQGMTKHCETIEIRRLWAVLRSYEAWQSERVGVTETVTMEGVVQASGKSLRRLSQTAY